MTSTMRYEVGTHVLDVTGKDGRWTASVDGSALDRWFTSSSDAWTAGVTEALRQDANAAFLFVGSGASQHA